MKSSQNKFHHRDTETQRKNGERIFLCELGLKLPIPLLCVSVVEVFK